MGQVFNQQVSQRIDGGADADFVIAAGEFIDQEHQATGTPHQLLVVRAFDPDHGFFMYFARQDAGLQQLVGGVEIEVVRWHYAADWCVDVGLNDLVNHRELVAQLAVGARLIQHAQGVFPKAAAHRQDRIVLREILDVVGTVANGGARQVARDFAQVGLHHFFDWGLGFRLLGQDHFANDCIDVRIGQLDANGETTFEFFQVGRAGDGGLAGADEEHLGTDVFATGFDDLLHVDRALAVFADVLLHLIEHYQGEREFAVAGEGLPDGFEHVATGNVLHIRIKVVQGFNAGCG